MKTTLGQVIVALILLALGGLVRRASAIEQRLAGAEADLATLQPDLADSEYAGVVQDLGLAGRLPFIGESLVADVKQERAMVSYWRGDYAAVPSQEAELTGSDVGAPLVFLAANARFRGVVGKHVGQEGAQDLDPILRLYTMLLKKDPSHADGSFNYEYVVRLRNVLAKTKPGSGDTKGGGAAHDQPPPSVHGDKGSPPPDTTSDQFNVIVPLRPEERGELMKAGTGAGRQRKG